MTPLKAIRAKCMDCGNDQYNEVKMCPVTDCALYPFRMGKNPHRKGLGNAGRFNSRINSGEAAQASEIAC